MEFNIVEELKKLPAKPGVYLMHDSTDEIIYVGKAVRLCNRVKQYFQKSRKPSAKIEQMVSHVSYFEYIVTDSEMEALVLECNLIKEHRPKYNTMLMDDKAYPYIKITVDEDFPRIMSARKMIRDKSRYFGPYPTGVALKETLELIHKIFMIRTCSRILPRDTGKERPCLNYEIKRCSAPCQGYISREEYRKQVDRIISLLNGNYSEIYKEMQSKMKAAAENMEFEEAAVYRDFAENVKKIAQQQKINDLSSEDDRDFVACAIDGKDSVVQVFFVREGKLVGREHYHVSISEEAGEASVISSFVKQYYSGTPFLPGHIYVPCEIEDKELIEQMLSTEKGRKVNIVIPVKGNKEKMLELAASNAKIVLSQDRERIKREEMRTVGALQELEKLLGLKNIVRMEAYDISNTSGMESVGSMVVYENGKPKKNDYRKFKIRSVRGPNDYASMYEVLSRRFKRGIDEKESGADSSFTKFPDLLMMDGGKGQVSMAQEVLDKLGIQIPVCGMVKDDRHRTRGLYYNNVELPVDTHSEGFHLITRIQDEAHRFAISFHKNLRGKDQIHSILDDIPGIGEKRRIALMRRYGDINLIKEAKIEELEKIEGMNAASAKSVYQFFHSAENALQN